MATHPPRSTPVLIDFINDIVPPDRKLAGAAAMVKHRVNAFVGTPLDAILRTPSKVAHATTLAEFMAEP